MYIDASLRNLTIATLFLRLPVDFCISLRFKYIFVLCGSVNGSAPELAYNMLSRQEVFEPTMFTPRPIGSIRSAYTRTEEIPKGWGAQHDAEGVLEILPEFEDGLLDIEGFSHLFVIWVFDRSGSCELVGTPPTDDRRHGVFATRSPRRPNPLGLTVVQLISRDGLKLNVRGVDMLDKTPILDLKPYLSSVPVDSLRRGWLQEVEAARTASRF
jgi:tRNA (adenine37-N6)-methyltransferase